MKYKNKSKENKYTLREMKRQKRENALKGDGEYRFVNNTRGDLTLEKPPISGKNPVPVGQTFVGDNYFLRMMKTGDIRLVEVIKPAQCERKEIMPEQKLMLDQPSRFTNQGQTEHVVPDNKAAKPLVENQPNQPNKKAANTLITEDPLEGVEILLG
jgi:hypothetical protein